MTQQWLCAVCDYLYDPQVGDPDAGVAPGTPFTELPEGWFCPDCGAAARSFGPVEDGG